MNNFIRKSLVMRDILSGHKIQIIDKDKEYIKIAQAFGKDIAKIEENKIIFNYKEDICDLSDIF